MRFKLFLVFTLFAQIIFAQHYNFTGYTVKDGLAQSQVRAICQDKSGYLWIGTASGLSRYNGIEFVNYSIDNGLPDNNISSLYLTNSGVLWVATARGVAKLENQTFKPYFFENEYRINTIAEFQGEIYFGTNTGLITLHGNKFIDLGNQTTEKYYVRSLVNYKDSILLCGTKEGLYNWQKTGFSPLTIDGISELNIRNISLYGDNLFITAREIGLFSYNLSTRQKKLYPLPFSTALSMTFYDESVFGISTNAGAFLISDHETLFFNSKNGLMESGLECLFKDDEGNIWMGTDGNGLLKFTGTAVVSYTTLDSLASNLILSIAEDKNDNFLLGSYDAGISNLDPHKYAYFSELNKSVVDKTVWSIMVDERKKQTWLGTSRGLTILDENHQAIEHPLSGINPKIRSIVRADASTVLLGGDEGLYVVHSDTGFTHLAEININKLYVYEDGVYCAASSGLFRFERAGNYLTKDKIGFPDIKVNTLTADKENNLWIGTENGLYVMRPNNQIFYFELDRNDYRSKNVLGLITGKDGSIWISTMKGVYHIVKDQSTSLGFAIFNYGSSEGLIDEEGNINAIYEDREQNIWIGTASGLARIDPSLKGVLFQYELPKLQLTGIRLFMEEFDYSDYKVEMDPTLNVPISIELPYNKNHLTFDFIGINLKDPLSVQYEYRLIGADEAWSPRSNSNYATYSFLQPGEYTFQVRAMSKNNQWSIIREIKVTISPPFWLTWWFITLVVLAVFFIILYIFQSRIRVLKQRQENEQLELKNRLLFLEQRSLNASMNRHFIFNSLNSIQYFINSSDKRSANKFLTNFAKLIRKNLDSSAGNNFIVTLQEEIERIELYLSLEKMRFAEKFEYEIDVSPDLDIESIEIPSMILQPFVENSIIHGILSIENEGLIKIRIFQELGEVVFEVTDNGVGIDISLQNKKSSGDGDHESKGVEITNRRIEILRKLTGENLMIIGPYQLNNEKGECLGTKVILKLGGVHKY